MLKNAPHPIWRRFVVPSNIHLDELHSVVQDVMGWEHSHLHAFSVGKRSFASVEQIEFDMGYGECEDEPETEHTLESIAPKKGAKIKYLYDFGDSWDHEIVVEASNYESPDMPGPIFCIEGVGNCPPEDCGGVWGFADFCEAIADPKHPEHKELKSWYGGKYDPDHFDLDAVNKDLGVKTSSSPKKKSTKKAVKKATTKKK